MFSCGVVSSPGLQRETHSGGPLLPTSYRPHGPPVLYLSHPHGPPMSFLLLFLWPHLENPSARAFTPHFLRKRQMEINQNHDHEPDGQIGQAGCHPWHVLPCKAISAALCQQRQASDPLAYILGGHLDLCRHQGRPSMGSIA